MEVPENIRTMSHAPVGEFVVEFFGSHDYFWINRGRAFFYHEGVNKIFNYNWLLR